MEVKLVADVAEESRWDGPGRQIFTEAMNKMSSTLQTPRWRWSRRTRLGSRQTRTAPTWSSDRRSSAACPRSQNSGTQPESWVIGLGTCTSAIFRSQFIRLFKTFSIGLLRYIFPPFERRWMSMVKDSLHSIMRSFCGAGQQIKEVFKVGTGGTLNTENHIYIVLCIQSIH